MKINGWHLRKRCSLVRKMRTRDAKHFGNLTWKLFLLLPSPRFSPWKPIETYNLCPVLDISIVMFQINVQHILRFNHIFFTSGINSEKPKRPASGSFASCIFYFIIFSLLVSSARLFFYFFHVLCIILCSLFPFALFN